MEVGQPAKTRRQWRALVKKLRRKKIRQQVAKERDRKLEEEETAGTQDPAYQSWLQRQEELEEFQRKAEEAQRDEEEQQWLRRELIAQEQFRKERERQRAEEAVKEAERLRQEKEYEEELERRRQKREKKRELQEKAAAEFERVLQLMDKFLDDPDMEVPPELRRFAETNPGRDPCQFFERTNCCRFGVPCVFNHRRPMLSRILLISHFFAHPQLEQADHREYGSDVLLEFSEGEMRAAYEEFFADVVPELEGFGEIRNFRTVSNTQPHLRGNVFVEYTTERAALKAFIRLQGRYYAAKRLNVEFSNIVVWRSAICGLSFARKCPQGRNCLYFHLFSNPGNKYNTPLEVTKVGSSRLPSVRTVTPLISWNDLEKTPSNSIKSNATSGRNWRWSESPEVELKPAKVNKGDEDHGRHRSRNSKKSKCSNDRRHSPKSKDSKTKERKSRKASRSRSRSRSRERARKRLKKPNHSEEKRKRHRSPSS